MIGLEKKENWKKSMTKCKNSRFVKKKGQENYESTTKTSRVQSAKPSHSPVALWRSPQDTKYSESAEGEWWIKNKGVQKTSRITNESAGKQMNLCWMKSTCHSRELTLTLLLLTGFILNESVLNEEHTSLPWVHVNLAACWLGLFQVLSQRQQHVKCTSSLSLVLVNWIQCLLLDTLKVSFNILGCIWIKHVLQVFRDYNQTVKEIFFGSMKLQTREKRWPKSPDNPQRVNAAVVLQHRCWQIMFRLLIHFSLVTVSSTVYFCLVFLSPSVCLLILSPAFSILLSLSFSISPSFTSSLSLSLSLSFHFFFYSILFYLFT